MRPGQRNNVRSNSGFSLIEMVVALGIFAIVLAVVYESFGLGLRRASVSYEREQAALMAQSLLAELRSKDLMPSETLSRGSSGRLSWQIEISDYPLAISEASPRKPLSVTIRVRPEDKDDGGIELKSVEVLRVSR
jgi:prepilin-type N-terminal cleavage/methylation domain-containing protein